ncbi:hypothetical protein NDN08_000009 [Rhodosorus marinus]|uniref:Uncharacterized protein n=1 Tax=Rhodosorus marinus TaxID=101924 RepID=A0AAV8UE21_9RHOD|nr:hypothetical protein NDN08_000009 [Rhodosorus marinus]
MSVALRRAIRSSLYERSTPPWYLKGIQGLEPFVGAPEFAAAGRWGIAVGAAVLWVAEPWDWIRSQFSGPPAEE